MANATNAAAEKCPHLYNNTNAPCTSSPIARCSFATRMVHDFHPPQPVSRGHGEALRRNVAWDEIVGLEVERQRREKGKETQMREAPSPLKIASVKREPSQAPVFFSPSRITSFTNGTKKGEESRLETFSPLTCTPVPIVYLTDRSLSCPSPLLCFFFSLSLPLTQGCKK